MIDLAMDDMPRDVRIAKAMLEYLASTSTSPGSPIRIAFTMFEEDSDVMDEICAAAQWKPKKWLHKRNTLSAVASTLSQFKYLLKHESRHNQEAMESGEPRVWYTYEMPLKYRTRFNPEAWGSNYIPQWTPGVEMLYLLRRVFGYEPKTVEVVET